MNHEAVIYSQAANSWTFCHGSTEVSVAVRGRVRVSAAEGLRAAVLADMGLTINSAGCSPQSSPAEPSCGYWNPGFFRPLISGRCSPQGASPAPRHASSQASLKLFWHRPKTAFW